MEFKITPRVGADTETNGLHPVKSKAFCIAFFNTEGQSLFIDFRKEGEAGIKKAQEIFDTSTAIFHNAIFDIRMLKNAGVIVKDFEDSMLAAWCVQEYQSSFKLDYLAEKYLQEKKYTNDTFEHWKKINSENIELKGYEDVPEEILLPYTIQDAKLALMLFHLFEGGLKATQQLEHYQNLEKKVMPVLSDMIFNGMMIDVKFGLKSANHFDVWLTQRKTHFIEKYGLINPASWQQVQSAFARQNIYVQSTKKEILLGLEASGNEFAKDLLEYRRIDKMMSGFIMPILTATDRQTLRVHPSFFMVNTKTGRLASGKPFNAQNLPRATDNEEDVRNTVRAMVIPRPHFYLIGGDYDQEEMRVMADECKCQQLIELFLNEVDDVYVEVAKLVWPDTQINKELRYTAKQSTLGVSYGMGPAKFVAQAKRYGFNIEFEAAYKIIKIIKERFGEVNETLQHLSFQVKSKGYVTDRFGKRYNVPDDKAYKGLNAVIQGTSAQIMKRSLIELSKHCNDKFYIINSVHDEVLCEVHESIPREEAWNMIKTSMEKVSEHFVVPIKMSPKFYDGNWAKLHRKI